MKNAKHFNIKFDDLQFEAQEAIIDELVKPLQEAAEVEGKEFLSRERNNPVPQTWQEAYVREYAIEYDVWKDYVDGKDSRDPDFIWETRQEEHVRRMARKLAIKAFTKTEIEVSLCK